MITTILCWKCAYKISVLKKTYFKLNHFISDDSENSDLCKSRVICPFCGNVNEYSQNNEFNVSFKLTKKAIINSFIFSSLFWIFLNYVVAFISVANLNDVYDVKLLIQEKSVNKILTFPWLYSAVGILLGMFNIALLVMLTRGYFDFFCNFQFINEFNTRSEEMPIGQPVRIKQTGIFFIIISIIIAYFILPLTISSEFELRSIPIRLITGGIAGLLANNWSYNMFFIVCRK
jgi:hypothetical protein